MKIKNVIVIALFSLVTSVYGEKAPGTDGTYKNSCHACTYKNGTLTCECCEANGDNCQGCKGLARNDDGKVYYDAKGNPECGEIYGIYRPTSKSCPSSKYKNNNGKLECE